MASSVQMQYVSRVWQQAGYVFNGAEQHTNEGGSVLGKTKSGDPVSAHLGAPLGNEAFGTWVGGV